LEILNIRLSELKIDALYILSYPIRPEICHQIMKKISPLPVMIINSKNSIIHGIDNYFYLKTRNQISVNAFKIDLPPREALILNYNLKEKLFGVNQYEKLIFLKKIRHYFKPEELHQKAELKISISRELLSKLDLLCSDEYKNILIHEKINLKTALKICDFKKKGQKALLDLFTNINFSSSQQIILIEMLEEILFRDKSTIEKILEKIKIAPLLGLEKPQKKILGQIYKLRYPLYTQMDNEWREKIKKMKLPDPIKIFHAPFFEKKEIQLKAIFRSLDEAEEILAKLKK